MMLRPRWPSAGPIGGEGFAAPAGTCNFRYPVTFFAICHSSCCFRTIPKTSQDRGAVRMTAGDRQSPSHGSSQAGSPLAPPSCPDLIRADALPAHLARRRASRFCPAMTIRSDLLDLTEFQLDRRGAAEDRHRDLHARARLVDF